MSETVVNPKAVEYFRRFRDWEGDEEEEVPSKRRVNYENFLFFFSLFDYIIIYSKNTKS